MARRRGLRGVLRHQRDSRQERAFTPFQAPTRPPSGTYDPSLDAEERAAERGFLDLQQDTERDTGRAFSDVYDETLGAIPNLQRQRREETQDYGRSIQELQRGFQRLGVGQTNAARAAGIDSGGVLAQALRKRRENETFQRQPIDVAHRRFGEENDRQIAKVGLDYGRAGEDRATTLARGGREWNLFRNDVGAQRFFQAEQSGADLPSRPGNERTRAGLTFRVGGLRKPLGQRMYTVPSGQRYSRSGFVGLMRRRKRAGNPGVLVG